MPCCSLLGASSPPKSTILSLLGKSRFSLSGEQKKVRMPSISNESLVALASGQCLPIRHLLDICVESLVGAQERRWHWLPQRQSPIVSKLDPRLDLAQMRETKEQRIGSGSRWRCKEEAGTKEREEKRGRSEQKRNLRDMLLWGTIDMVLICKWREIPFGNFYLAPR